MTFYNVYIELSNSDNVKKQLPRERETDRERVKWQITSLGEGLIVLCTISAPFLQICNYFKVKFREGEEEKRKGGRKGGFFKEFQGLLRNAWNVNDLAGAFVAPLMTLKVTSLLPSEALVFVGTFSGLHSLQTQVNLWFWAVLHLRQEGWRRQGDSCILPSSRAGPRAPGLQGH